jgi:hypothetical protein
MKKLLLVLPILFSATAFGQRSSDLTFHLSTYDDTKLALEYRVPIKDKWGINFALAYGSKHRSNNHLLNANDSIYTDRYTSNSKNNVTFRLGTDRRIKESMFSVGFDFLLGYSQQYIHKNSTEYTKDSLGNWGGMIYSNFGVDDPTYAQITKHYIVPGVQLNTKMDIPIKNNFEFNLSVGYTVNSPLLFNETNIVDPFNELTYPKFNTINAAAYASIGLRYKFVKKDNG